jgi:ribosomal protein L29
MIDVAELRDLSVDDLQERAKELEDQIFRMRLQQSLGQLDAPV